MITYLIGSLNYVRYARTYSACEQKGGSDDIPYREDDARTRSQHYCEFEGFFSNSMPSDHHSISTCVGGNFYRLYLSDCDSGSRSFEPYAEAKSSSDMIRYLLQGKI